MDEELQNIIRQEIERLTRDIEIFEHNANTLNDLRIIQMEERFTEYLHVLENALNNGIEEIINYANEIYGNIDWNSTVTTDLDNRIDTLRILVFIMNLLNPNGDRTNFNEIELNLANARNIIDNINNTGNRIIQGNV